MPLEVFFLRFALRVEGPTASDYVLEGLEVDSAEVLLNFDVDILQQARMLEELPHFVLVTSEGRCEYSFISDVHPLDLRLS